MMDEKFHNRMLALEMLGLKYSIAYESYTLNDINVHWTEITTMKDNEWNDLIKKIKNYETKQND